MEHIDVGWVLKMRDLQVTMVAGFNAKSWSVELKTCAGHLIVLYRV